jgi:hypothetical protein
MELEPELHSKVLVLGSMVLARALRSKVLELVLRSKVLELVLRSKVLELGSSCIGSCLSW